MNTCLNIINKSLLLFALLIITNIAKGQYYSFELENEAYQPLSNPQYTVSDSAYINNNVAIMHQDFKGSNFTAFGKNITSTLEAGVNCYIVALGDNNDFIFDPFLSNLRSDGSSEFRATYDVIGMDSVLQMEWSNFRIVGHPDSDFVNVTARVYTTSEIIEFHYGPSSISINPSFPGSAKIITLILAKKGFTPSVEELWLSGDPLNPTLTTTNTGVMNAFPIEGTVYRFKGKLVNTGINNISSSSSLVIYPNPANDFIYLNLKQGEIDNLIITDMNGRSFVSNLQFGDRTEVSIDKLSKGIYWLNISLTDGTLLHEKFIKN